MQIANNAITDGKYIVFGVGSTQLLHAAVHALPMDKYSTKVVANKIPYYSVIHSLLLHINSLFGRIPSNLIAYF